MANQARWLVLVAGVLAVMAGGAASAGGHGRCGHHDGCRNGQCMPHCPVRPGQFGYHGTQWRRWPGTGIVPVSAVSDAVPVRPPRSAVPGPDEESPRGTDDEPASTSGDAAPGTGAGPVFDLPAATQPAAGAGDGAQVPLPLDLPTVNSPRPVSPSTDGRADAAPGGGQSRGWRQFVDSGVAPTSARAAEAEDTTSAPVELPQAAPATPTRVAPVEFYPPRPPQAGRPQRAGVPARGR